MSWFGSQPKRRDVSAPQPSDRQPLRTAEVAALYQRPPSFTDFLPWVEYLPESRCFLLEDGVSVGALFELTPVGTEARTATFMVELRDAIQTALAEAIPELDSAPWVLQLYVQDEPSLADLLQGFEAYVPEAARKSAYTQHYLELLRTHCARISRPGGLFEDTELTGSRWRGQVRRVRATLYRRQPVHGRVPSAVEVEAELNDVATKWVSALAAAGVHARRGSGADLYRWLLPWFNPRAAVAGGDPEELLSLVGYPGE